MKSGKLMILPYQLEENRRFPYVILMTNGSSSFDGQEFAAIAESDR